MLLIHTDRINKQLSDCKKALLNCSEWHISRFVKVSQQIKSFLKWLNKIRSLKRLTKLYLKHKQKILIPPFTPFI